MRSKTREVMTMNSKIKVSAEKSFNALMGSLNESEEIMIEARIIMYRFLSEIDIITNERGINRKELAKLAGTSPSYITQLYQGKKIINMQFLARIKKALNIDFTIKVIPSEQNRKSDCIELTQSVIQKKPQKSLKKVPAVVAHGLIKKTEIRTAQRSG
jgi:transcriptional regulator with XRE-family HTH domain